MLMRWCAVCCLCGTAGMGVRNGACQAEPEAAQEAPTDTVEVRTLFLTQRVPADYALRRAWLLLEIPGQGFQRLEAVFVPASGSLDKAAPGALWWIGARAQVPVAVSDLRYSIMCEGDANRFSQYGPFDVDTSVDSFGGSTGLLRERLLQRKGILKTQLIRQREQESALERLRADADVIANLSRIVEVREETARARSAEHDLEKDIANLQELLRLARTAPLPKNFAGRESQLTRQIAELADAARLAESQEQGRRATSEEELQRRVAIIERTRNADYDALQRELLRVRRQRLLLERESTPASVTVPEAQ